MIKNTIIFDHIFRKKVYVEWDKAPDLSECSSY